MGVYSCHLGVAKNHRRYEEFLQYAPYIVTVQSVIRPGRIDDMKFWIEERGSTLVTKDLTLDHTFREDECGIPNYCHIDWSFASFYFSDLRTARSFKLAWS